MARPIFLTGLARGGTNLLARMLTAGGESRIAIHAFQPWFKSLRNAIITHGSKPGVAASFDPDGPFNDGYFDNDQIAIQDMLHGATIDVPFSCADWPSLSERILARAAHDASHLCSGIPALAGSADYHAMMDRILALILNGHAGQAKLVGLIDTWIIDLFPALARAYPEARFLVVIRDPRAVVASQLKFLESDPVGVGHVLSILRQWRKYVVLAHEFQRQPPLAGRLRFLRFEDQVNMPERFALELCEFLDLTYRPEMVDLSAYEDHARDRKWTGNSAFESGLQRIDPEAAQRWRRTLPPGALAATEFCCAPDMEACGYAPVSSTQHAPDVADVQAFMIEDGRRPSSWRTDSGDIQTEFDHEVLRRTMLASPERPTDDAIRRAFLAPAYFDLLKSKGRLFPDESHVPEVA